MFHFLVQPPGGTELRFFTGGSLVAPWAAFDYIRYDDLLPVYPDGLEQRVQIYTSISSEGLT
jgi:hypothetical protein